MEGVIYTRGAPGGEKKGKDWQRDLARTKNSKIRRTPKKARGDYRPITADRAWEKDKGSLPKGRLLL